MEPAIRIRNLSHSFGTGALRRQVLFDVSADIFPGEIVISSGPSGSGKTTMLTLLCGLRTVQEGSVRTLQVELNGAPATVLGAWHLPLTAEALGDFARAFPHLRYEVRVPTLDDLFLKLALEPAAS